MNKSRISITSLILAILMLTGAFVSCDTTPPANTTEATSNESIEHTTLGNTTETEEHSSEVESETVVDTQTETETETETEVSLKLEGENALLIENAERLSNVVQSYYSDSDRTGYTIENMNMSLDYNLTASAGQMVTALKNSKGASYVENTMDVFVKMTNGKTYYASNTDDQTRVNIYRYGYYYYDIHMMEQDFENSSIVVKETELPITSFTSFKDTTRPTFDNGELEVTITNKTDPQIYNATEFNASDYNNLQFTFKSDTVTSIEIYIIAGSQNNHNNSQKTTIEIVNDGEWHTVSVPLTEENFPDYTGTVRSIRLDINGIAGTKFQLKDVKVQKMKYDNVPLSLDRIFHTFPDKLHQELHIVAYEYTKNIEAIGMITEISADRVAKLIVKDKNGLHTSLDNVDWASAEYIGFDIKDAGIFGYILPYDNESGTIDVVLKDGKYVLTQTDCPDGGYIKVPVSNTLNDFRMGHRLYTDESHDFDKFLNEAYCERNPLSSDSIVIDNAKMGRGAKYKEYNALRGVYQFTVIGTHDFNEPYYNSSNLHYNASFSITGDDRDRSIYIMTYTSAGILECAALLDENNLMLPVKLQVSKNFSEVEEPFYNCGDLSYGETFFPMIVKAGERSYLTVLNLYQNWGTFPLKQLSSIGYYMPYYHLSTGVTETNCIAPWYNRGKNLYTLPDYRSMSMPASSDLVYKYAAYGDQPQRPNEGYHYFLQYTDAYGNYVASEYLDNVISCAGPTYADLTMNYLSDDGKIRISYRHLEMPQIDENRAYYEITYEVLDTVKISNFREDFSFYTATGYRSFSQIGYLNEKNEHVVVTPNTKDKPVARVLGDDHPYFAMFYLPNTSEYSNISCLISDYEFIIGGKERTENLVIIDQYNSLRLSLNIDGAVTLQAGDRFTINAIMMPWGGSWKLDNGTIYHNTTCENVIRVRENTLLNPFKLTAVESCTVTDSVFLPVAQTTDGKSATFTLSGGCDYDLETIVDEVNIAVRINGFSELGRLKVEELVDGKWITYEVSSRNKPDKKGYSADYDGYAVHYDGDGTYGYSFVVKMTDGLARTFKVTVQ